MKTIIRTALFAAACAFAQPPVDWDAIGDQINRYHPPHHCTNGLGNDVNTPACQENQHDANTPEPATWILAGGALLGLMALCAHRQRRQ